MDNMFLEDVGYLYEFGKRVVVKCMALEATKSIICHFFLRNTSCGANKAILKTVFLPLCNKF